jgi:hypothetical protein
MDLSTRDPRRCGSPHDAWVVLAMIGAVVLPAALTLLRVDQPRDVVDPSTNPTPFGYTWSLLLYLVPVLALAGWLWRHPELRLQRSALLLTLSILVPLGFGMDLLFGPRFFAFRNRGATLGIEVPALGGSIPIEELVFYAAGFFVVLLLYMWTDEYWMGAYNIPDYGVESKRVVRLMGFDTRSLLVGAALVGAAAAYKKLLAADPEGFPWYFAFLVGSALVPSVGFYRAIERFVNWRAFSVTFFLMLLVSLLWEATLGVPYQWWNYNPRMMLDLFVDGWTNLPLEAVFVWLVVSYTSVIVYETVKVYRASGRSLKHALWGAPHGRS